MTEPSLPKEASPRKKTVEEQIKAKAKTLTEWYEERLDAIGRKEAEPQELDLIEVNDVLAIVNMHLEEDKRKDKIFTETVQREFDKSIELGHLKADRAEHNKKLQQLIDQWDKQSHLGYALQETDWLLGEFGQLRKLLKP